ncbi:MAG: hypothetical protein HZT40_11965 [Candidatus Thiothrix singaporensis]|uniref:Uncharacterized protein n=1 Tax=Candidatus Thiothrix singaporensis TaxID=2799669 RepID=A0A7L6AST3_9GAMM|nr:MAG: hypothetical protein HZT40_11965 [Candidatus Thiothrix singaporensis]
MIEQASGHILHVAQAVSNEHDVTLARQHTEAFPPGCLCLGDLGYQGLEIEGCRILIPFKSPGCGSWNRNRLLSTGVRTVSGQGRTQHPAVEGVSDPEGALPQSPTALWDTATVDYGFRQLDAATAHFVTFARGLVLRQTTSTCR